MTQPKKITAGATFLTEEQIWGDEQGKGQLQLMKDFGTKTGISDLAIVLGGYVNSWSGAKTSDNQPVGVVWSASSDGDGYVRGVHDGGGRGSWDPDERLLAARPALPSSVSSKIEASNASLPRKKILDGKVDVVEYGEYPQTIAKNSDALEAAFEKSSSDFKSTDNTYTFDAQPINAYSEKFKPNRHPEYAHTDADGITRRYVRVLSKENGTENQILSNSETVVKDKVYWLEVQPIEWLKDPSGMLIAKQALFPTKFDDKNAYDGKFEKTFAHKYLNETFLKEMQQTNHLQEKTSAKAEEKAAAPNNKAVPAQQPDNSSDHAVHEVADPRLGAVSEVIVGLPANALVVGKQLRHSARR